jgi:5-methylcytosine-specific restriction enzyme subunit McrC
MSLGELFWTAIDTIRASKVRAFLTTLGVVIGVLAVILLVALGEGVRQYLADTFSSLGSNVIQITPGKRDTKGGMQMWSYDFLLKTCELIFDNLFVDESDGTYRFRDFREDDDRMWRLFQAFVLKFYQRELPMYRTKGEQIPWDVEGLDEASEGWLPQMQTDITLRGEGRTIIIDTKFHRDALQTHFQGKRTIKSENLYQLMAYLKNAESRGGSDVDALGILLYPQTDAPINRRFKISGHEVRVRTVDLSRDWKCVHEELLDIVAKA